MRRAFCASVGHFARNQGKAYADHERQRENDREHDAIAERKQRRDAATGRPGDEPRQDVRARGDDARRDDRTPTQAAGNEPNEHRAPQHHERDVEHETGEDKPRLATTGRSTKQCRADLGEWNADAAEAVADRDESTGCRGGRHRTNDDTRGRGNGASRRFQHVEKQAAIPDSLKGMRAAHPALPSPFPAVCLVAMHAAATSLASILIVEDSPDLVALLHRVLCEHGYDVSSARDGESGLSCALAHEPDLLILDIGLPRRNGFEVVQELRRKGVNAPTLILTGRGEISDRITGLDAGADDYLVKPFDTDELVARVRALLRRSAHSGRVSRLCVGDVVLDPLTREVARGDRRLSLTRREFSLLEHFMRNAGEPLSRASIARQVWQQTPVSGEETNIVDVYVAYLRKKLDTDDDEPMLQTVRGVGYVLKPAADGREAAAL